MICDKTIKIKVKIMSEKEKESKATKSTSSILQKPANLECKDLNDYLKSQPPDVMDRLYNYPTICLAVYR